MFIQLEDMIINDNQIENIKIKKYEDYVWLIFNLKDGEFRFCYTTHGGLEEFLESWSLGTIHLFRQLSYNREDIPEQKE